MSIFGNQKVVLRKGDSICRFMVGIDGNNTIICEKVQRVNNVDAYVCQSVISVNNAQGNEYYRNRVSDGYKVV